MPRFSQTSHFLLSPSFQQAPSALIGQLTQPIAIGRTPQVRVGKVTPLTLIASFSFQISFSIIKPERGTESRDNTQWWCSYVFAVHKPSLRRFLTGCTLLCDVTLFPSHTHNTLCTKLSIWTVNSKYLKGTYYAKITFIRCLNSCVAAVCRNNQPIMVETHPLFFLQSKKMIKTVSQNELFQILPRFTSLTGKSPAHLWCCPIDPFTVYVTGKFEVRSAHVGVRTFIPSHCVNQRISRQDKT